MLEWLVRHDALIALSTVAIAEIAFGIARLGPDPRTQRLQDGLLRWRRRYAHRIFALTEEAALRYGEVMGRATGNGRPMPVADAMIAAIALVNGGQLATRNMKHFEESGLQLISPWDS